MIAGCGKTRGSVYVMLVSMCVKDFDINTFKITEIYVRVFRSPVQSVPF